MESLSDKNKIWQLDEILLILFASGRFHNVTDLLVLSAIFERLFPKSHLIGFNGNKTFVARQIESSKKKDLLISIGSNVAISAKGRTTTLDILNAKILKEVETNNANEDLIKGWKLFRKILARLPRVRAMWDQYLEDFLRRLNK